MLALCAPPLLNLSIPHLGNFVWSNCLLTLSDSHRESSKSVNQCKNYVSYSSLQLELCSEHVFKPCMAWFSDLCFMAWAKCEQWRKVFCIWYTIQLRLSFHDKAQLTFCIIYQTISFFENLDSYVMGPVYEWGRFKSFALNSGSLVRWFPSTCKLSAVWSLFKKLNVNLCSPPEGWAGHWRVHIHRLNWRHALTIRTIFPLKLEIVIKITWVSHQELLL